MTCAPAPMAQAQPDRPHNPRPSLRRFPALQESASAGWFTPVPEKYPASPESRERALQRSGMKANTWGFGFAAALTCGSALAQQTQGERPPRPDSASNAPIGGWCDALTGTKKDECLRDERRRQEERKAAPRAGTRGCDALVGQERERCLRQGGTLEVDAKTGAGATAREQ